MNCIKIGISTCKKYANKTLPHLVNSLTKCGIESSDIFVFNGGYSEKNHFIKDGINCFKTNHNSYDYTSYIEILENKLDFNWFLIQDTCFVGKNFKKQLYEKTRPGFSRIALKSWPPASMSMGFFTYDFLKKHEKIILALKDLSKEEAVLYEDLVLRRLESDSNPITLCPHYAETRIELPPNDFYKTGTHRIIEYFPELDFYKVKSNWGQSGKYITDV